MAVYPHNLCPTHIVWGKFPLAILMSAFCLGTLLATPCGMNLSWASLRMMRRTTLPWVAGRGATSNSNLPYPRFRPRHQLHPLGEHYHRHFSAGQPLRLGFLPAGAEWTALGMAAIGSVAAVVLHRTAQGLGSYKKKQASVVGADYDVSIAENLRPKAVIFDLDSCIWLPDTWDCSGAPFVKTGPTSCRCKGGETLQLLPAAKEILYMLRTNPDWHGVKVGVASSCCFPHWAEEFFDMFELSSDMKLRQAWDMVVIQRGDKRSHFKRLSEGLKVAYEDMIFFDDIDYNCSSVAQLGVTAVCTPRGMTLERWREALQKHAKRLRRR